MHWFWRGLSPSFTSMRTLSPVARQHLEAAYTFSTVSPHLRREADHGGQHVRHDPEGAADGGDDAGSRAARQAGREGVEGLVDQLG